MNGEVVMKILMRKLEALCSPIPLSSIRSPTKLSAFYNTCCNGEVLANVVLKFVYTLV